MGFVPFDNVLKLESVYLLDGQYVENVYHYWSAEEPTIAMATALAAEWKVQWNTHIKPLQCSDVSLQRIDVTSLQTQNAFGITYTTGLPVVGTHVTGEFLPSNVSVVVRWLTNLRGRSYRGRTYHIGLATDQVTTNNLTVAFITDLLDAYYNLIVLADGTYTWAMGVASRVANGQERANGLLTLVATNQVDPVIDSQRRRLPQRGR